MKVAVISDVHANMEAFTRVLQDAEAQGVDELYGLGDLVGYGPDPEEVVRLARRSGLVSVMGNHDDGVNSVSRLHWFNPDAKTVLAVTRRLLSDESLEYLAGLPVNLDLHGALLVHGCPPSSFKTYIYMVPKRGLERLFRDVIDGICFVGHTHELAGYRWSGERVESRGLNEGVIELLPTEKYIFNIGSVGQPRDGDPRAKYVVWDTSRGVLDVRFVPYPWRETARKILDRGFPEGYARRLGGRRP